MDLFGLQGLGGEGSGFWMIQVHQIYCALYYYYIHSISDHQVLSLRGWGPCYRPSKT